LLYFAYGSNLLPARLLARTPSARALAVGCLAGHGLRWHMAATDGSGKCDVVVDAAAEVHGVVYRLDPAEKPLLDRAETLGVGYSERRVRIATVGGSVEAWTYTALRTEPQRQPYDWYRDIVVAGARAHGLAADYVAALAAVAALPDPDPARAALHRALLTG
jgi:gamma-glutamylcyclotransferase